MVKRKKIRKMPAGIRPKAVIKPARKVDKAPEIAMRKNIKSIPSRKSYSSIRTCRKLPV